MTSQKIPIYSSATGKTELVDPVEKTEAEWRAILPAKTFEVAREKGTEAAFSGAYYQTHDDGIYQCACCGTDLFDSGSKFESGTGWPSFTAPIAKGNVKPHEDRSYGMLRVEVLCARCGAHLGHVFDDGPAPTHQRYCMNSASLKLVKRNPK
jgi:peptide-methionine (R)-S-oxide reductase